jgi:hypothetical protein
MSVEMQAGRELDREIAGRVFGATVNASGYIETPCTCAAPRTYREPHCRPVPAYSTDIAAAFEIPKRIGGRFLLELQEDGRWYCHMSAESDGSYEYGAGFIFTSPAEAICRAALSAIRHRESTSPIPP